MPNSCNSLKSEPKSRFWPSEFPKCDSTQAKMMPRRQPVNGRLQENMTFAFVCAVIVRQR
jgi:hypothetical protein